MLKVGDAIKCHDADDLIETMKDLAESGIETDFVYEKAGEKGLWLEITKVKGVTNAKSTGQMS